ncbi:MAG: F0F1 ATP synthase subunit A [Erysipelotrichaceae bacterium]|nr:F0F1 ATP synthase subunit A [Erysipelotrichaceae bacterium]
MNWILNNLQPELLSSLTVTIILAIAFVIIGKKIKAADPLAKPSGVVLVAETGIRMLHDYIGNIMPKKFEKFYYPYMSMLFIYLICLNLWGLTGFETPTTCYSVTLGLATITFILIQWNSIKHNGVLGYLKSTFVPPTNVFGAISPLISLSMRLFCNLLSGTFIMSMLYMATSYIATKIIPFNFFGPIIAPVLHIYFDIFSGVIQALVFVTLSSILISVENPEEE